MKTRRSKAQQEEWLKKLYNMKSSKKYLIQMIKFLIIREKCLRIKLEIENCEFEYRISNNKSEKLKLENKIKELYKLYERPPKEIDIPHNVPQNIQNNKNIPNNNFNNNQNATISQNTTRENNTSNNQQKRDNQKTQCKPKEVEQKEIPKPIVKIPVSFLN